MSGLKNPIDCCKLQICATIISQIICISKCVQISLFAYKLGNYGRADLQLISIDWIFQARPFDISY